MKQVTNQQAVEMIASREPFQNSTGSFRGRPESLPDRLIGRLPGDPVYKEGLDDASYVVYSYGTPIAWTTKNVWHIPAVKYSVTTSAHQSKVRWAAQRSGLEVKELGPSEERKQKRQPSSTGGGWGQ